MTEALELSAHPFIQDALKRGILTKEFVVVDPDAENVIDLPPEFDPAGDTIPDRTVYHDGNRLPEPDQSPLSIAITRGVVRANTMTASIEYARDLFVRVRDDLAAEILAYITLSRIALYPDLENIPLLSRAARMLRNELGMTEENEADMTFARIKYFAFEGKLHLRADVDYETQ